MAQGREAEDEGDRFEAEAVSAFSEAFNNVAIHGFRELTPGNVDIEISWSAEELLIQMTDSGHSFDPDTIEPPAFDELPEGGMGIFIMRSFMDEVAYQAGPPNVLRMVKRRGSELDGGPDDAIPFSSDAPRPPEGGGSSSQSDWRMSAVADAGSRASATWGNDGAARGDPAEPAPRIEARVVGGSRRT